MIKNTYAIYHETLGSVIDEIRQYIATNEIVAESFENRLINGIAYGTTGKLDWEIESIKNKRTNKWLHASVYRMETGRYELTLYVL